MTHRIPAYFTSLFSSHRNLPSVRSMSWALCALAAAVMGITTTAANAQTNGSVQTVKAYDIAPGPLGPALAEFAARAGVNLHMDRNATRGKSTPGLASTFSVQEGFDHLLAGSGFRVRRAADGSYILEKAPLPDAKASRSHAQGSQNAASVIALSAITVSGRTRSDLMSPTQQVTILDRDQLDILREGSDSVATLLSKAIPGMSDSSHTVTDFGQTLRGRNMLVLVDGIPLSTNRDSSRNLANINPADVEQIEVLRGSSAIYGSGAAGGIVSIRTRQPDGESHVETTVSGLVPLSRPGAAGLGGEIQNYFSGGGKIVDYSLSLGMRHAGGSFDAHGHRIAPEPSQGDLFDSNIYDLSGKLGFRLDTDQHLLLSASHYDAKQDTDYASDPSVAALPPGSTAARSIKGLELKDQNRLKNTMINLDYQNRSLAGSKSTLGAQIYYRDLHTRFAPFDARKVSVRGANVDQVMQDSEVLGGRLTIKTPLSADKNTELTWGADFNQERSRMPLDTFDPDIYDASGGLRFSKTGRLIYMPPITTRSLGVFAQLEHRFNDHWAVQGGMRYDRANAHFNDFVPLSQLRVTDPASVQGGNVRYGAWTSNAGVVFNPVKAHELYASFSQGFDLPDIGVQVRNATPAFNINSSDLQPVKTNSIELGWRGHFSNMETSLGVFRSHSKLGGLQSLNNGLILLRTEERIYGVDGGLDYFSDDNKWKSGGTLTWMNGREKPQGSSDYRDMTGYRIPPLKLTAYVEYTPSDHWSHRVQATYFAPKDYRLDGKTGFGRWNTSSYATVDLASRWQIDDKNKATFGIENIFNRYYFPRYSQLMRSSSNTSRLPGAGAVFRVSYFHQW